LNIKLRSNRGEPETVAGLDLSLHEYKTPADIEAERQKELEVQQLKKRQFEDAQLAKLMEEKQQKENEQKETPPQPILPEEKLALSLE
jgi:hypothetical protein